MFRYVNADGGHVGGDLLREVYETLRGMGADSAIRAFNSYFDDKGLAIHKRREFDDFAKAKIDDGTMLPCEIAWSVLENGFDTDYPYFQYRDRNEIISYKSDTDLFKGITGHFLPYIKYGDDCGVPQFADIIEKFGVSK